ncbi:MAG: sialate O-acetylesterase [Candidatus Hydrogenedentes bacterium]|nr:sialate O-acetylesterase [Candidatus Hydrogenedentota bacterium]
MKNLSTIFCFSFFILISLISLNASSLKVNKGLMDYQVLQANEDNVNYSIEVSGECAGNGTVELRVLGIGYEIIPWKEIAKAENGKWRGTVEGIPLGGPYKIDLRLRGDNDEVIETASIYEVLVGDIWILAGQSNMQGVGNLTDTSEPHPLVHVYSMAYRWQIAKDPLHILEESPDVVHSGNISEEERAKKIREAYNRLKGAGLGLPFAVEMVERTGRPIGLIASAHGGTSMTQWDPDLKDKGGESLYGSMFKQVMSAGGKVKGVLWYQGESDASKDSQPLYKERMKKLVSAIRRDFGNLNLPFYYVQIGRFVVDNPDPTYWNKLQNDQLELEKELAPGGMVASIDLPLDDLIHIGTDGLKILGYRLANLVEKDLFGAKYDLGPRCVNAERIQSPYGPQVKVTFSNVNGRLLSEGRPAGFSISATPDGPSLPIIYKITFSEGEKNVVYLWITKMPEQAFLWYGRGFDPYCNIVDEAKMAIPVFGPMPVP